MSWQEVAFRGAAVAIALGWTLFQCIGILASDSPNWLVLPLLGVSIAAGGAGVALAAFWRPDTTGGE